MKRKLVELNKKDFVEMVGKKKTLKLGGKHYCYKCGKELGIEKKEEGVGKFHTAKFFLDVMCWCESL